MSDSDSISSHTKSSSDTINSSVKDSDVGSGLRSRPGSAKGNNNFDKGSQLATPSEKAQQQREQRANDLVKRREEAKVQRAHASGVAGALAIVAALMGGGLLGVLLSPAWAQYPPEDAIGICQKTNSCDTFRTLFGISAAISFTLTMLTLLLTISVSLGFSRWLSWAIVTFTASLDAMAVALVSTFWLAYGSAATITATVLFGIFFLASLLALTPAFVMAWYNIYGNRIHLQAWQPVVTEPTDGDALLGVPATTSRSKAPKLEKVDVQGTSAIHYASNGPDTYPWTSIFFKILLQVILVEGGDANLPTANGSRPLHLASAWDAGVVRQLLEAGADVDGGDESGMTSLMVATYETHVDIVDRLIAAGANVNAATTDTGWTALMFAAQEGHLEIVERLIAAGANVNTATVDDGATALYLAAGEGHLDVVQTLIDTGADVDAVLTDFGYTALIMAAQEGHLGSVVRLIDAGANVNAATTDTGDTALMSAAGEAGHLVIVEELIAAGADVNAATTDVGNTALILASGQGYLGIIERLIRARANVNAATADTGVTALIMAAGEGYLRIVERLIAAGADVNAATTDTGIICKMRAKVPERTGNGQSSITDEDDVYFATVEHGDTGLHLAAFAGYAEVVASLLAAGANFQALNKSGHSPLDCCTLLLEDVLATRLTEGAEVEYEINRAQSNQKGRAAVAVLLRQPMQIVNRDFPHLESVTIES